MKQTFLYSIGMLLLVASLSACGKWEPKVSGGETATGSALVKKENQKKSVKLDLDVSSKNKIVIPDPAQSHGDVIHIQLQKEDDSEEEDDEEIQKKYLADLSFAGFSEDVVVTSHTVGHMTSADSSEPDCLALHVHEHPELMYSDSEAELEKVNDYLLILDYGSGTCYKSKTDFFFTGFWDFTQLECRDMTGDGKQELVIWDRHNKTLDVGIFRCDEQNHKLVSLFSTMEEFGDHPDRALFSGHLEDDYKVVLEYPDIGYKKTISMIQDGGYKEEELQADTIKRDGGANFVGLWEDGKLEEEVDGEEVFLYTLFSIDFVTDETGAAQLALMRPVVVGHRSCGVGYMHTFFQYDRETDVMVLKRAEYVTYKEEEKWNYTDAAIPN